MKKATAYANANIALVKYWGKNDSHLNIPAVSSLSMTLSDLGTTVTISPSAAPTHELFIHKKPSPSLALSRLTSYLEHVRLLYPFHGHWRIDSQSSVPYASGLASSASFFAALALAINHYLELHLKEKNLTLLARMGSGSAARSIFPGFAGLYGGVDLLHQQSFAFQITVDPLLDLHMILAIINTNPKAISSRDAMNATKETSPFFKAFIASQEQDFNNAIAALKNGSFEMLGSIMEHSTLKMFSTMWTAQPAINYWQPKTVAMINLIYRIRDQHGPIAYFTMDAGPNVKILCPSIHVPKILSMVTEANLTETISCVTPGSGAQLCRRHLL